jgi:multiple sugar transport system permease protein
MELTPSITKPNESSVKRTVKKRWDSPVAGYLFIMPWLIGFFVFVCWPMVMSLYYSFTDYSLLDAPNWVGLKNYIKMFTVDPTFWLSLKVTFIFVMVSVPLKLAFALLVAVLLNRRVIGMAVFRTLIYFPSLIGTSIAVAILWQNIMGREGFIVRLLSWMGIRDASLIDSPDTALFSLILLIVWQFGSAMVIFLAGLKQIPADMYEASSIDGAGKVYQFFRITLPMLSPVILFNLILQIINSFQMFTQAFIITEGGPINATYMYALYLYDRAFTRFEMGYASALAWTLLVIIGLTTLIIFGTSRKWVFYENEGRGAK